jgi:hypothetical protein
VVDVLAGFRYLDLEEDLDAVTGGAAATHISTRNQFYGGQLGARASTRLAGFYFGIEGKVGLGNVHETDSASQNSLAFLAEVQAKVGFTIANGALLYVSYNFLYLDPVARPGDQLTAGREFNDTYFWAHGIEAGLEVRY